MKNLEALTREQASEESAQIFDAVKSKIGMVPNLYATIGNSAKALNGILTYGETLGSGEFSTKQIEAVALAVSQKNSCDYCLAAHTALGKMNGLSEEDTIAIRTGEIQDEKLNALTTLAADITETRGFPSQELVDRFFNVGFSKAALVELIGLVALNTFNNYTNNIADTAIDFPQAPALPELA
ncbi:MAG: carboxymuconolactone decarboxylase family protein [Bacteroidota bacterium]